MRKTNLKQPQIRVIRADLLDQKIIREIIDGKTKKYEYQFDAPDLNTKVFEELRNAKLEDLKKMIEYVETDKCRMNFLCDFLGDKIPPVCGKCDNDCNNYLTTDITREWIDKIEDFWANYFPVLELESSRSKLKNGIAASFYGKLNAGNIIEKCKYKDGGDFPDLLLQLTLSAFYEKLAEDKFDMIVYVPPVEAGDLVKNFARKISLRLNIPLSYNLKRQGNGKPQRLLKNKVLKRDNVSEAFIYTDPDEIKDKSILIIDDVFDTGATINALGKLFSKSGVKKIVPLVIAKTMGGDLS
ncbi:MAG: RecQ family zinc-binding domain-containing protein, partial [Candidatus Eremiobacterota bacterium]